MENWLYLIRIVFILIVLLFIQGIINTIQKDVEKNTEEKEIHLLKKKHMNLEAVKGGDKIKLVKNDIDNLEQIYFGRDMNNDIVADDKYISGSHFKISKANEEYIIEDLNSTNGTILNGKILTEPNMLKNNDVISLGEIQFKIHIY